MCTASSRLSIPWGWLLDRRYVLDYLVVDSRWEGRGLDYRFIFWDWLGRRFRHELHDGCVTALNRVAHDPAPDDVARRHGPGDQVPVARGERFRQDEMTAVQAARFV